jgi:ferredoxin
LVIVFLGAVIGKENPKNITLTKENPIKINEKDKSLTFLAEVNGKYFHQPTRHGVIFKDGKLGDKPIFRAYVDPKTFHDSLIKLGFKPGNNMTMENKETTLVEGNGLGVTVTWEGAKKEYRLDEVIKDSNGKPILIRFGGNLSNAIQYNTGCLICLDSCPVGITSNASYTYGAVEKRNEVGFTGNKEVLPPDGTRVVFKVTGKK